MFLIITLLFTLTQQPEPVRVQCEVKSERELACVYPDDNDNSREFPLTLERGHKWLKHIANVQWGVTTLIIEEFPDKRCLMQVHMLDGWNPNPVNERINECVPRRVVKGKRKLAR